MLLPVALLILPALTVRLPMLPASFPTHTSSVERTEAFALLIVIVP
jgi:hypothetical protein